MNDRRLGIGLLCLLSALASQRSSGAESSQESATFQSKVELITVDAVVLDPAGKPVRGLTRDDFVLTEDGRPKDIASFEAYALEPRPEEETPAAPPAVASNGQTQHRTGRAFALLVDDLRIQRQDSDSMRQAVARFIQASLSNGDEVTVGTTSGKAWWSARIPEGRDDLLAVLKRVEGSYIDPSSRENMTEYEAFWINNREQGVSVGSSGSITEQLDNPSSLLQRVVKRWLSLSLCGTVGDHTGVLNCNGTVKGIAASIDTARRQRVRLTLAGVRRALDALAPVQGRTSLLLFSPGFLQDNDLTQGDVTAAARESHTAVYFIDVRGLVTDSGVFSAATPVQSAALTADPRDQMRVRFEEGNLESEGSQTLADDTGGFSVKNTNDIGSGVERIGDESRVFYLLGFYPSPGKSPRDWRKLKIEVKQPGLKVRSRKGYTLRSILAEDQAKPPKKNDKKENAKIEPSRPVARALESVHDAPGIPLRAMTYVLDPRANGLTHVVVAVELDTSGLAFQPKGKERIARVEITVAAMHRDSGRGFLHDDPLELKQSGVETPTWRGLVREFELPSGVSQARVVARDATTGAIGSVTQRFEVPSPETLRVSTPILTDHVEPAKEGRARPQAALAVHRTFLPGGGLYCQFEVFGATRDAGGALHVSAGLVLKAADGRQILKADPTPITPDAQGRLVRLVGIPLEGLAVGPYDIVLKAYDQVADAHVEKRESFTLSQDTKTP
jgi:VWFA-related protein